ncbi:hypothetical protein AAES_119727 [Amazona aestiva]|uniref:Uncharacterized protein n=1 Tax=Amazona aestiva TaxID=12930 RepID=A0A0Q3PAN9_AMAAE|nr:hypothetical protein AAES_119727 [Amazona aestiva]
MGRRIERTQLPRVETRIAQQPRTFEALLLSWYYSDHLKTHISMNECTKDFKAFGFNEMRQSTLEAICILT